MNSKLASTDSRFDVEESLLRLTDNARLERGRKINDEEFVIKELSRETVKAKVRKYTIEVNLQKRLLKHDCDDWRKGISVKRVCKHLVKSFWQSLQKNQVRF